MSNPVVIPSSVDMTGAKKLARQKRQTQVQMPVPEPTVQETNTIEQSDFREIESTKAQVQQPAQIEAVEEKPVKRGRGRPRKNPVPEVNEQATATVKRGRGRPRKNPIPVTQEPEEIAVLPGIDTTPNLSTVQEPEETILPGISEEENSYSQNSQVTNNTDTFVNQSTRVNNTFENSNNSSTNSTTGELKTLARNTNLRSAPTTSASKVLYLKNTTLYVLEPSVAEADGYIWDRVRIRVNGKEGYMINKNYK